MLRYSSHTTQTICPSSPSPQARRTIQNNHETNFSPSISRRRLFINTSYILILSSSTSLQALAAPSTTEIELERAATQAYAQRDFETAVKNLNQLVQQDPTNPKFRELRAITLVDGKNFSAALRDYDQCLALLGDTPSLDRARVLSGRGLAYEGISDWVAALNDYDAALEVARRVGADDDPYILNSRGNCQASLGEWALARDSYLNSARGFQTARRINDVNSDERDTYTSAASMQKRLDGAVFSFANAALMLAQMGDEEGAIKEMQSIARRAPGSMDMRAALAALLWHFGEEEAAETEWEFGCNNIAVGCSKYTDEDWVQRIRRWPPVMVERLSAFLRLRSNGGAVEMVGGEQGRKERKDDTREEERRKRFLTFKE